MKDLSVIVLTFNSEAVIEATLLSALKVSDDVHVVDSFSTDGTLKIVRRLGVNFIQHTFTDYSAQRNWAIQNLSLAYPWQLHLDADESLSDELIAEIKRLEPAVDIDGYFIARQVIFLGRPIRHGGMFPIWHMRLFRTGSARCEDRRYDQHFVLSGKSGKLFSPFYDIHQNTLSEWTGRHNRWSDAEAEEIFAGSGKGMITGRLDGNPIERKRYIKERYYQLPLFWRAFLLFIYRFIIRLGFLDGRQGLVFFVLQTFWFRFLVDAKYYEKTKIMPTVMEKDSFSH